VVGLLLCGAVLISCGGPGTGPIVHHQWIYVSMSVGGTSEIRVYALDASGTVTPDHIISGPHTGLAGPQEMALDYRRNLYVANALNGSQSITVYPPDASGDVAPIRTISGGNTQLLDPKNLALNSCGDLYVLNTDYSNVGPLPGSILLFGRGQQGNVAPGGVWTGSNTLMSQPFSMAKFPGGDLFVTQHYSSLITAYDIIGGGTVAYTLGGGATGLYQPYGLAADPNFYGTATSGMIYVINGTNQILVFPNYGHGNPSPSRAINLPAGQANLDLGADTLGNVYLLNSILYPHNPATTPLVDVYGPTANGSDPPILTLTDPGAGFGTNILVEDDPRPMGQAPEQVASVAGVAGGATDALSPRSRCV
jgi:hypothetical protein